MLAEQQRSVHSNGAEMYEMTYRGRSSPRDEVRRAGHIHFHHRSFARVGSTIPAACTTASTATCSCESSLATP